MEIYLEETNLKDILTNYQAVFKKILSSKDSNQLHNITRPNPHPAPTTQLTLTFYKIFLLKF